MAAICAGSKSGNQSRHHLVCFKARLCQRKKSTDADVNVNTEKASEMSPAVRRSNLRVNVKVATGCDDFKCGKRRDVYAGDAFVGG